MYLKSPTSEINTIHSQPGSNLLGYRVTYNIFSASLFLMLNKNKECPATPHRAA